MIVPAHAISNRTITHITGNHTTYFPAVVHNSAGGGALPHGSLQFKRPAYKKRHGGRQTAVHGHEFSSAPFLKFIDFSQGYLHLTPFPLSSTQNELFAGVSCFSKCDH